MSTNITGMSPKNFRKISHLELETFLYLSNFSKKITQLTDWQTNKKFVIIWKKCTNIPGMSQIISGRSLIQNRRYPYICLISVRKLANSDLQTYKNFITNWKQCENILGMSPKNFRMITHLEQEISLHLSNFSKEVS